MNSIPPREKVIPPFFFSSQMMFPFPDFFYRLCSRPFKTDFGGRFSPSRGLGTLFFFMLMLAQRLPLGAEGPVLMIGHQSPPVGWVPSLFGGFISPRREWTLFNSLFFSRDPLPTQWSFFPSGCFLRFAGPPKSDPIKALPSGPISGPLFPPFFPRTIGFADLRFG